MVNNNNNNNNNKIKHYIIISYVVIRARVRVFQIIFKRPAANTTRTIVNGMYNMHTIRGVCDAVCWFVFQTKRKINKETKLGPRRPYARRGDRNQTQHII
jgi:hypothetical protein